MDARLRTVGAALRDAGVRHARIDARALAALRIALGSILVADILLRARSLTAFYTDSGIVTRQVLADVYPVHRQLSLHAVSGEGTVVTALFVLAGIAALALAAGYRTRLATLVSFLLLISLQARNPTVLNSGDVLLRRLLFFGLFLPLGARWSVDALAREDQRESVASLASLALLLQVTLVYMVNAAAKLQGGHWMAGDALGYVLKLEGFTVFLGPLLADVGPLATALTWTWFGLLLASWLLVATTGWPRAVLAGAFLAMHAGMALTMDLGVFPLVSIAAVLPFFPPAVWDRLVHVVDGSITERLREIASPPAAVDPTPLGPDRLAVLRPVVHAVVLVGLLVVTAMGVGLVPAPDGAPEELSETSWRMFAHPPTQDTWVVAEGTFASGRTTDLLRDGPVRTDRPPDTDRYPNARWRKHLSRYDERSRFPAALADYQCRRYADRDPAVTTVRVLRSNRPVAGTYDRANTRVLGAYRCGPSGATAVESDGEE
jgi:hypothetical protein